MYHACGKLTFNTINTVTIIYSILYLTCLLLVTIGVTLIDVTHMEVSADTPNNILKVVENV